MGIRPRFQVILGIDDVIGNDVRWVNRDIEYEKEIEFLIDKELLCNDKRKGEWLRNGFDVKGPKYIYEILYNERLYGEYVVDNIVGFIHYDGKYDSQILRAFAAIDEKYLNSGYMILPSNKNISEWRRRIDHITDEDIKSNRVISSVYENMSSMLRLDWARAQFYLKQAGWEIPQEQLKLMLVWTWS